MPRPLKSQIGAVPLDDQRRLRPAAESKKFGMMESFVEEYNQMEGMHWYQTNELS